MVSLAWKEPNAIFYTVEPVGSLDVDFSYLTPYSFQEPQNRLVLINSRTFTYKYISNSDQESSNLTIVSMGLYFSLEAERFVSFEAPVSGLALHKLVWC